MEDRGCRLDRVRHFAFEVAFQTFDVAIETQGRKGLWRDCQQRQLERGERLTAVLRQRERRPLPLSFEIAELWGMKMGLLDDLAPLQIDDLGAALEATAAPFPQIEQLAANAANVTPEFGTQLTRWLTDAKARLGPAS